MDIFTFLGIVVLIHAALCFTDQFLKSCMNMPYLYFLENAGLTVKPLQLCWFTTAFNRSVTKWALWRPRFFKIWFTIGAVVVGILLLPSLFLLVRGLVSHIQPSPEPTVAALQPMVPGINIPVKEFPYYFLTLLVASIIHEIGHAIAAVKEDVHVNGFGFLIMVVFPGAYVDVPTEEIRALSSFRQLKILCAGVWHNVVLVVVAFLLALATPYIVYPLYIHGQGLTVMTISQDSPARGATGLDVDDVVTGINRQAVVNVDQWHQHLLATLTSDQIGFCVPESVVHTYDETIHHAFEGADGSVQCCNGDSEAHLCFELKENHALDTGVSAMQPFSCLPARIALSLSTESCISSATCPANTHCLAPSLRNASRLVQVHRRGRDGVRKDDVLYLGPPAYLYHTVSFTNFIPKYAFLPNHWPNTLEVYCDYMVKFSGALAVLNMVPVLYLDGYWIFGVIIDLLFSSRLDQVTRRIIHVTVTIVGTILLFLNIAVGVWSIL